MKILKKIMMLTLAASLLLSSQIAALATIDELWGVPFLAYGASLSEAELEQMHTLFGLEAGNFDSAAVDGHDLVYFLGRGNPNSSMLSSALITHREAGTGVEVEILTPNNITRVTDTQYATAMITAGVTDALVQVASPQMVTGEAALAGIYKAFSERGVELDEARMAVAQEQLEITSNIADYHEDNDNFDSTILDQAVIEIQGWLADHYEETGQLATPEEIENIINEVLENNNLDGIITPNQLQNILGFASRFQLTDAINSPEFRNQLNSLADRVGNLISDLNLNIDNLDRSTLRTWWDNAINWLRGLFS